MMYMPDAIQAAISLMEADPSRLKHRNAYNVTSMSIDPKCLAQEIKKLIPNFTLDYRIDPVRQKIAESWPNSMDDSSSREDWGWRPRFDLKSMTLDMLQALSARLLKTGEMPPGMLW
jgi:nucleoside-diphosphate-sugar epimerase